MTDTKHTPGPWKQGFRADSQYDGDDKNHRPIRNLHTVWQAIESVSGARVATCGIYVQGHNEIKARRIPAEEAEANAHLIAAAPELLEALEIAEEIIRDEFDLGETVLNTFIDRAYTQIKAAIRKAKQGE